MDIAGIAILVCGVLGCYTFYVNSPIRLMSSEIFLCGIAAIIGAIMWAIAEIKKLRQVLETSSLRPQKQEFETPELTPQSIENTADAQPKPRAVPLRGGKGKDSQTALRATPAGTRLSLLPDGERVLVQSPAGDLGWLEAAEIGAATTVILAGTESRGDGETLRGLVHIL